VLYIRTIIKSKFLSSQRGKHWDKPESIEGLIEGQTFSMVNDLAPRPPPTPHSPGIKLDWRHLGRLRKREKLLTGEGVGGGRGAELYDCMKFYFYLNH
jgi:hypothetical protein